MIESISDAVFDFAKSKLKKSYSLLKDEGFSYEFVNLLIIFTSIGAIAFGLLALFVLVCIFFEYIGLNWRPLFDALAGLMNIIYADNIMSLIVRGFVVLHLPIVILIIVQKTITGKLIKKYRDKESNLIKP
jgi:hypothetical protein